MSVFLIAFRITALIAFAGVVTQWYNTQQMLRTVGKDLEVATRRAILGEDVKRLGYALAFVVTAIAHGMGVFNGR